MVTEVDYLTVTTSVRPVDKHDLRICYNRPMIIHLTGPDTYRSHRRMQQLRTAFVAKHDPRGFSTVMLDGETAAGEEIRTAITTSGFFSAKRFVGLDRYTSAKAAASPKQLLETLSIAEKSNDIIVVVREIATVPGKKPVGRTKKSATTSDMLRIPAAKEESFATMTPSATATWVIKETKERGGKISPAVANQLVAMTDNDAWRIANELDKLVLFAQQQPITVVMLRQHVASPFASDIFALTDAIGLRQHPLALRLLHHELGSGTNPLALITIIASHIRTLLRVLNASADGRPETHLAADLKLHPFVVKKALIQSRKFLPEDLRQWHHRLVNTDFQLKTTPHDAETLLGMLILKS